MRKGFLEYCVLGILSGGEAYVSDILKAFREAKLIVVEGTLYPLLTRMKNEGLLSYRWEESTGGPPRKYYSLTPRGASLFEQLHKEWDDIKNAIDMIVKHPDHQE